MRALLFGLVCLAVLSFGAPALVLADQASPLFVNLTSDEAHRSLMAVSFGRGQQKLGHPLTIYLNDKGVLLASKAQAGKFPEQQKILAEIVSAGGVVLVCPMCSKKFEVGEADLLPGAKISNPELTGEALFKDKVRTLSW